MAQRNGSMMEFTREAWENAPEGAILIWSENIAKWTDAHLIGFRTNGEPVVEASGDVRVTHNDRLRIILPKRKVTVQLWRDSGGGFHPVMPENSIAPVTWTLLGEHTFEIEGE